MLSLTSWRIALTTSLFWVKTLVEPNRYDTVTNIVGYERHIIVETHGRL